MRKAFGNAYKIGRFFIEEFAAKVHHCRPIFAFCGLGHIQQKDDANRLALLQTAVASPLLLEYSGGMMRILTVLAGLSVAGFAMAGQNQAVQSAYKIQDCSSAVDEVLTKTKGRLLSVKPRENRCIVTVIVPHGEQRPEKVVVRVDYTDANNSQENGQ